MRGPLAQLYEMNQRRDRHVLAHDELVAAGKTVCRSSFQLISSKRVEQVTIRLIVVEESDTSEVSWARSPLTAWGTRCRLWRRTT